MEGLADIDSLSLDSHKWLFQPYEIGCVLVRNERWLTEAFHILPEYLQDIAEKRGEVNLCDRGIQLTRGFRALKLWMSLKVFGRSGFQKVLHRGFELAEAAVRELPRWEMVPPAQMGVVTFRYMPEGMTTEKLNRLNRQLVEEMTADGFAMISSTVLRGETVLRICTINPRATEADIRETIERLNSAGERLLSFRKRVVAGRPQGSGTVLGVFQQDGCKRSDAIALLSAKEYSAFRESSIPIRESGPALSHPFVRINSAEGGKPPRHARRFFSEQSISNAFLTVTPLNWDATNWALADSDDEQMWELLDAKVAAAPTWGDPVREA